MPFALKGMKVDARTSSLLLPQLYHPVAMEAYRFCAFTSARVLLTLGTRKTPEDASLWNDLGRLHADMGDLDEAVEAFHKAIQLDPDHTRAYGDLGLVLRRQEHFKEAEDAFRKQIEVEPEVARAHLDLGDLLMERGRDQEAIPELQHAARIKPRDPHPLVFEGEALLHLGDTKGALEAFAKAQELATDLETRNDSAYYLAEAGAALDLARTWAMEALKDAEKALDRVPGPAGPMARATLTATLAARWDTLGWVYFRQGDLQKALAYLQAAAPLGGTTAELDHLGQVSEALGDREGAIRAYARSLALPGRAESTRARLYRLIGKTEGEAALGRARLEASKVRRASLSAPEVPSGVAEFDAVIGPKGAILDARLVQGLGTLWPLCKALKDVRHPFPFPTADALRVPLRIRATVPQGKGPVTLEFLDAQETIAACDTSPLGPLTAQAPPMISIGLTRAWAAWAGPAAAFRGFTPDRIQRFLEASRTQPLEPLGPELVAWLQNLARAPEPNLSAWALARLLEGGDATALPAYQSRMYDHLRALSVPGAPKEGLLQDPPFLARTLAVSGDSPFWATFRQRLHEKLDEPLDRATYAVWCYATNPDQLDLVLEQAAHVKPTPTNGGSALDPWNDPRFWIVADWALAWGREEDFKALAETLPDGSAREEFLRLKARMEGMRGFFGYTIPPPPGAKNPQAEAPVHQMKFEDMKIKAHPPAPEYPPEALGRRLMTTVNLALTVSAEGEPLGAHLQPGPWLALFGPTAYAHGLEWRFEPALINGVPQVTRFTLAMPFTLKGK